MENIFVDPSEIKSFLSKEFSGLKPNIGDGYWFIPASQQLGWYIHYEYNHGKIHMDIEGNDWDWRRARYFFVAHVNNPKIKRNKWGRRYDCRWTLDTTPSNWEEIKNAFIEIRGIMSPYIKRFENELNYYSIQEAGDCISEEVDARKVTVQELLSRNGLEIPDYQRPYRWTERNVEQLLQDVYNALLNGKRDYLIGSVILHHECKTFDIVDGQQRLTTLCLIMRALHFNVTMPELKFDHTDSFQHIRENFRFIENWIHTNLAGECKERFGDFLLRNCLFVQIIVKKLSEAFQLFETQNGRGKPLEAYNLLKAYHIRAMTDVPRNEKIECDVRWEDAAAYITLSGERHDLLRQVINEHLFRSRIWSRGVVAGEFRRGNVDEFKGLSVNKDSSVEFAYQNVLLQQLIASALIQNFSMGLFKVKSRFEHGDPENMSPFVSLNQLIVNGKPFFDYIETFIEMYKRIFVQDETSQLSQFKKFYKKLCKEYKGHLRSGDTYIRQVYKSAIIHTFDKFGEKGVDYLYKALYLCLYRFRLEYSQVRYSTMANNSGWIFSTIHHARTLRDLDVIKQSAEKNRRNKRNFDVPDEITKFFDGNEI